MCFHIIQNKVDKTSLSTSDCILTYVTIMHIVTYMLFCYFQNDTACFLGCVLFKLNRWNQTMYMLLHMLIPFYFPIFLRQWQCLNVFHYPPQNVNDDIQSQSSRKSISGTSHHQLFSNYNDNTKMKQAYLSSEGYFLLYPGSSLCLFTWKGKIHLNNERKSL